jgi:hypothetical protein
LMPGASRGDWQYRLPLPPGDALVTLPHQEPHMHRTMLWQQLALLYSVNIQWKLMWSLIYWAHHVVIAACSFTFSEHSVNIQ